MKEEEAPEAHAQSDLKVRVTHAQFMENVQRLASLTRPES
jgi:hypothetical protein